MKPINVVSLFNGMGTLRQAFEDLSIPVNNYYSSEIKPHAIKLQQHHFPEVIQVGDINNWKQWDINWANIDFIGSGSPCQDLSAAGKRAGINGAKSSLFFIFIDILNHVRSLNPNVIFLQENVGSANTKDIGIMSRELGLYPVRINSSLVTAQMRDRYYWTNIKTSSSIFDVVTDIPQPKDKGVLLKDIITNGFVDCKKATCLLESHSRPDRPNEFEKLYNRHKKQFHTVVFADKNLNYKKGVRIFDTNELCLLQGFKSIYCDILTRNEAASLLGDGWTLPIITHILSFMKLQ